MWESARSTLVAVRQNFLSILGKSAIVLVAAFSVYVVVKYFAVFSSMSAVSMKEVGDELESVQVSAIASSSTSTSAYFRSFLLVVLGIGKLLITGTVMFASFFVIEAHGMLPTTVLCFLYGLLVGLVGGHCFSQGRLPWSNGVRSRLDEAGRGRSSCLAERVEKEVVEEEPVQV